MNFKTCIMRLFLARTQVCVPFEWSFLWAISTKRSVEY